jgi:transcriptional regulator with XRE-family HTH domain
MDIGDVLRKARIQSPGSSWGKLGLVELSDRCGVSQGQIARIEKNLSRPRILTLVRISNGLGLTLDQIREELKLDHLLNKKWTASRKYEIPLHLSRSDFLRFLRGENDNELAKATGVIKNSSTFELYRSKVDEFPDQVMNLITKEFESGTVITFQDLSSYLLSVRKQQNISQWELGKLVEIDYRAIRRLENAELQLLDWDLLLKIDQSLELDGALVGLAWAVAEFESGIFLERIVKEDITDLWSDKRRSKLTDLVTHDRLKKLSSQRDIKPHTEMIHSSRQVGEGTRPGADTADVTSILD